MVKCILSVGDGDRTSARRRQHDSHAPDSGEKRSRVERSGALRIGDEEQDSQSAGLRPGVLGPVGLLHDRRRLGCTPVLVLVLLPLRTASRASGAMPRFAGRCLI
jgi:hypothetical protein